MKQRKKTTEMSFKENTGCSSSCSSGFLSSWASPNSSKRSGAATGQDETWEDPWISGTPKMVNLFKGSRESGFQDYLVDWGWFILHHYMGNMS